MMNRSGGFQGANQAILQWGTSTTERTARQSFVLAPSISPFAETKHILETLHLLAVLELQHSTRFILIDQSLHH